MTESAKNGGELARGERLQIMIGERELSALDDFRFANRMPSRASAIRELLRRGLDAADHAVDMGKPSKSFGILDNCDG